MTCRVLDVGRVCEEFRVFEPLGMVSSDGNVAGRPLILLISYPYGSIWYYAITGVCLAGPRSSVQAPDVTWRIFWLRRDLVLVWEVSRPTDGSSSSLWGTVVSAPQIGTWEGEHGLILCADWLESIFLVPVHLACVPFSIEG